jgi:phosphate transport system substrate-binding protein
MRFTLGRRGVAVAAGAVVATMVASTAIAGSTAGPTYNLKKLKGSVTADGSSTVGPYTTAAAELFRRAGATGVKVTVGISGTGGGFQRFCKGEIDLSDASRPMRNSEAAACKTNNVGSWRAFTVANDALSVVTNQQNTWARCLTVAELKKIWEPGSKVNNWKDVRAGFPDVAIKLFGPGTDSGTFEYFTEAINGRARASRTDYQASEDDNVLVQGVEGDTSALGYFGFSYYEQNADLLNLVAVDEGSGCVAPSSETIQDGSYSPLSRPLFMYPSEDALAKPEVAAFVQFVSDNYSEIAEASLIVPMSEEQASETASTVQGAVG